jgi:hypothetical protein
MLLNDLLVQPELMPSVRSAMIIPQYFIDAESSATVAMGAARSRGSRTARITGLGLLMACFVLFSSII